MFAEAGFTEIVFDAEPTGYGVAVHRLASDTDATFVPERLFTFCGSGGGFTRRAIARDAGVGCVTP